MFHILTSDFQLFYFYLHLYAYNCVASGFLAEQRLKAAIENMSDMLLDVFNSLYNTQPGEIKKRYNFNNYWAMYTREGTQVQQTDGWSGDVQNR